MRLAQAGGSPLPPRLALVAVSLLLALAIAADACPSLRGPAPYPPEWQWGRRAAQAVRFPAVAMLVGAALLGVVAASARWRERPRAAARALLAAATLAGPLFALALLAREPEEALRALMARAQSFSVTSYHTVAASEDARDPRAFLRAHAGLLPSLGRTAKHAATHPPGPVLWYRGAIALCESSPRLANGLLSLAGVTPPASLPLERRAARAGALLGALGFVLLASLAVWPTALLGEALGLGPLAAARAAALLVLLPGPALFAGSLDAALALPVTAAAALLLVAAARPSIGEAARPATAAGACAGIALFGSYGSAAFLALAGLAVIAAAAGDRARAAVASALAGGVAALLAFGVPALLGHEPLRALQTALAIHRAEYTAPRDYRLWLAFNPLDFALFAGLPIVLVALWRARGWLGRATSPLDRFRLAVLAGLGLLVLSGLTRGEVGRLWIPLVPLVLLSSESDPPGPPSDRIALAALAATFTLAIGATWLL